MKFSKGIIAAVVAVLVLLWGVSKYNGLVGSQEQVNTAWAQVENNYQRRADLIPNLVNVVKGYASHERETLEGTENRIATARRDFNEIAKTYNLEVRSFPNSLIAGITGFRPRPYFTAQAGSDVAPVVDFSSSQK